jgi:hypothetical protein
VRARDVPRWQVVALERIDASPGLDLVAIAVDGPVRGRAPSPREAAYRLYERLDRLIWRVADDPLAAGDIEASARLRDRAVAAPLRADDLDVVADFGASGDAAVDEAPRHGVWTVHHGDLEHYRDEPPHFWELYDDTRTFGTAIVAARPDGRYVVYRSFSATDWVSLARGRSHAYWKTAHALVRRLAALRDGGWERIAAMPDFGPDPGPAGAPRGIPTTAQVVRHVARMAAGVARRRARRAALREDWFVAYRRRSGLPLAMSPDPPFTLLDAAPGRMYADPFVIERDGDAFVFVEDVDRRTGRAVISCARLGGGDTRPKPVLARDHHLSYPFVFEHDGEVHMVPETAATRAVDLYRAAPFPSRWEPVARLLSDLSAVDPTLFEHDGRWWMFAGVADEGAGFLDELFLYFSDSLTEGWTPHPLNPVVSDVRRARPAGPVVKRDGALLRLGQDSSRDYGDAIAVNRIEALTPTAYRERQVATIRPDFMPGVAGTHAYTFSERYEAIDGRMWRPRLALPRRRGVRPSGRPTARAPARPQPPAWPRGS